MTVRFDTVLYTVNDRIATITFNRPERLNAIGPKMPRDIREAIGLADADDRVHVVVIQGAGRAFCSGYDLIAFAEQPYDLNALAESVGGSDPTIDYRMMKRNTDDFMSMWHCSKPVIAKVHGPAIAGGSDIALCADLVVMADDARIGYPPARVWGIPTTMMWIHRVGAEKAKRMLFTGDVITGVEAAKMGLILESVPASQLDARVQQLAERIASVPRNQLFMSKLVVNAAVERQGLQESQRMATFFDGFARHSREGQFFEKLARTEGFHAAVQRRDRGEAIPESVSIPSFTFESLPDASSRPPVKSKL